MTAEEKGSTRRPLKIDIIVPGRFYAFDLACALLDLQHDVRVLTNYPKSIVAQFGLPEENVRSFVRHGLLSRLALKLGRTAYIRVEPFLHRLFGRWAMKSLRRDANMVIGFSGVMEETLDGHRSDNQARIVVRSSTHIAEQARLLVEEEGRAGVPIDRPTGWMIAREQREYLQADLIVVLSRFAYSGFLRSGVAAQRLRTIPLGVRVEAFRPSADVVKNRERRILDGAPLRILMTGTFSFRKGALDLAKIAAGVRGFAKVRFVGDCPSETWRLRAECKENIEFLGRVPEAVLGREYEWADIFIFTTIEDGFAAVLLQATAAGLPILATSNCSAPDFVVDGELGWVVPARDVGAFLERLRWCDANRPGLARICATAAETKIELTWQSMACRMIAAYADLRDAGRSVN
jgi:glycosyltransferase involved in cell wall biosynthesis